jgi:DnaJ-class molecular chaperone
MVTRHSRAAVACTDCNGTGEIPGRAGENGIALAGVCPACDGQGVR